MGDKNRIKFKINGSEFVISADEDKAYITHISKLVDDRIAFLEKEHHKLSNSMATVLAALNYCDELEKEKKITSELLKRNEECTAAEQKAKADLQSFAVENEQLKEEKKGLHARIEELKEELRAARKAAPAAQQQAQPAQQQPVRPQMRERGAGQNQRGAQGYGKGTPQRQYVQPQKPQQQPLPKINYQDNDKISDEYRRDEFQDPATEDEMLSFFDNR